MTEDRPPASLRERTLSGVKWMSLTRLVAEVCALVSSVVLARLVPPAEFGRTAVATFLGALALGVAQQGVGSFLVAHRAPTPDHVRAAVFAALAGGALGAALTAGFALSVAPLIFGDRIAYLVALSTPMWLLAALLVVPLAVLQRRLSFGRVGAIEASAAVVGPAVSVLLAVQGLDGESLIIGALAGAGASAILAWTLARPPRPGWRRGELGEIARYGMPVVGSSALYTGIRNVDYLLLAAFMPARQVGLYMRAFVLGSDYQLKISQILISIAFPVFSRAEDREQMRRIRARMVRVHAIVLFPLLFGLIAVAPEFVPWMYGERWADAAILTQILALGGMIAAVGSGTGSLMMATGNTRALFAYTAIAFVAYTLAVLIAIPFGVIAVCVAVVVVRFVTFVVLQHVIVEPRVGIPILSATRDEVIPALAAGVPQLLVTMAGLALCLEAGLPVFPAMLLPGVVGLAVYAGILARFFPATWSDVRTLARSVTTRLSLRKRADRRRALSRREPR